MLFNIFFEKILAVALALHEGNVSIWNREIDNILFANNIAGAKEKKEPKELVYRLDQKRYEKSPGSATITNLSPSQTPRGRGNRQNQTSANRTNVRKAPRQALSLFPKRGNRNAKKEWKTLQVTGSPTVEGCKQRNCPGLLRQQHYLQNGNWYKKTRSMMLMRLGFWLRSSRNELYFGKS